MVKLLAYYLPQFHTIPENDEWWGKGFTEWTNTKRAKPLFKGHYQPRIPYRQNYYDLSNPQVMVKQMQMAKKYGIYGFCFYHYWFGNGRILLDKPLENLINTPEANLPFCIAWANENWVKTWHGNGGKNKVLIEQEYGNNQDWLLHIDWLLRLFKDERYIKKDNKPMLLIYNIDKIPCRDRMLDVWNRRVKEEGFDGIWLVAMKKKDDDKVKYRNINASVSFEPRRTRVMTKTHNKKWSLVKKEHGEKLSAIPILRRFIYTSYDYDEINQMILNRKHSKNEYRGAFTNYDDTPRRREWAVMFKNSSPRKFQGYLEENIEKSISEGNEFLFINAWNEWGEGAYLEPDEKYGYAYLNAVRRALDKVYKKHSD